MNGTGTHSFLRLDTRTVLAANHFIVLPVPDTVVAIVNSWAHSNKHHILPDPIFTLHDRVLNDEEITDDSPPDTPSPLQLSKEEPHLVSTPEEIDHTTSEVRGDAPRNKDLKNEADEEQPIIMQDEAGVELEGVSDDTVPDTIIEAIADSSTSSSAPRPARPMLPMREPLTRITKPVDRLNLMSVNKAARMFPEKSTLAMEAEVASLLGKQTFKGVHRGSLSTDQRKRILRSIMNITEKFLPTLNDKGVREIDKVKSRLCVDGRAQSREDYLPEEVESPTASIASIFAVAQIAALERRFIMVGDVGTGYLNARMPLDDPDKILHMRIEATVATIIVRQDQSFKEYIAHDGSLIVRLEKAIFGCIESARLWYTEISSTLHACGFVTNPRDPCVHNKMVGKDQFTIIVYVDDLKMTCRNKEAVLDMERTLLQKYGQFRTTHDRVTSYLGCTWDYSEPGFVQVSQVGMIQDLVTSRERTHADRGTKLEGSPSTPGAAYLFDRTTDCPELSEKDKKTFHTDVATALYLANRTRADIALVLGELCKRVKTPTIEDDKKLDRLITYLRCTRDLTLRLGSTAPVAVTVSIDAAFTNRDMMRPACVCHSVSAISSRAPRCRSLIPSPVLRQRSLPSLME
jgi:Reverse transcriptase (RNA-dependent DNA polymerase)